MTQPLDDLIESQLAALREELASLPLDELRRKYAQAYGSFPPCPGDHEVVLDRFLEQIRVTLEAQAEQPNARRTQARNGSDQ